MKKIILLLCVMAISTSAFAAKKKSRKVKRKSAASEISMEIERESKEISDHHVGNLRIQPFIGATSFFLAYDGDRADAANDSIKAEQGLTGGALVDIGQGLTTFQTGLMFLQAGQQVNDELNVTTTETYNYLAIPAYVKFNFSHDPLSGFFAKAGLLPAYLLGGSRKAEGRFAFESELNTDSTSTLDIIASLGGGAAIQMSGSSSFVIEATYNRGFIDFHKKDNAQTYNQGIVLTAGAVFGI